MNWLSRGWHRHRLDRELDRELRFHVDEETRRLMAAGVPPVEARRQALAAFGGLEPMREATRDVRGWRSLETLQHDLRNALRMMRRSPAFTGTALLSLAIGIGANAAVFSVTDALLLRPLPVDRPEELYLLRHEATDATSLDFSAAMVDAFRAVPGVRLAASSGLTAVQVASATEPATLLTAQLASGDWFDLLGVHAAAGRVFTAADDVPTEASHVAVLSYACWAGRFRSAADIVGSTLRVNNVPVVIVGIASEHFEGTTVGSRVDLWLPLSLQPAVGYSGSVLVSNADAEKPWIPQAGILWLTPIGRAPSGAPRALAELQGRDRRALESLVATVRNPSVRDSFLRFHLAAVSAARGLSPLRDRFSLALVVLMTTATLVLLLACANLASLTLARGSARARELALRQALGASRTRLIRQLLTESLLLAVLGGIAALVLARLGGRELLRLASSGASPIPLRLPLDWHFLGFTLVVSLLTGLAFGSVPAWRFARGEVTETLRSGSRTVGPGSGGFPWARLLVVGQMALALVLLVFALLFARTMRNLLTVEAGYDAAHIIVARFDPRLSGFAPAALPALYERLLGAARTVPGARGVALAYAGPITGSQRYSDVTMDTGARLATGNNLREDYVSVGYFATMGMPLVAGRDFLASDTVTTPKVAVVNEAMVRRFLGTADAIGRHYGYGGEADIAIVGVVRDAKVDGLREPAPPMAYYPFSQHGREMAHNLYVRVVGPVAPTERVVGSAVVAADRNLAPREVTTVADLAGRSLTRERLVSGLTVAFGLLAVVVAFIGLYGTVSFSVTRRTVEIGVRLALGAAPAQVRAMVVGETLWLVGAGALVGLLAVTPLRHSFDSLLFGLTARDPVVLVSAAVALGLVGLVAGLIPAWRASRVDPLAALRQD
jgi:predicted permease